MRKIIIVLCALVLSITANAQKPVPNKAVNAVSGFSIVNTINDLRNIEGTVGDIIYIKGHTAPGDGGGGNFIWSNHVYLTTEFINAVVNNEVVKNFDNPFYDDNNGILIQATTYGKLVTTGRWVRQYDGYINVRYFGVSGQNSITDNYTQKIKQAVDFAYANASIEFRPEDGYAPTKGTTVYFPNGSYIVDKIAIRNGVALVGDSFDKTIIVATVATDPEYTAPASDEASQYLFQLDEGVVQTAVSNFNIVGRDTSKGVFYLVGRRGKNGGGGGLWNSVFKNIKMTGFLGNGMHLKGGDKNNNDYDYSTPCQFNIFENVRVQRKTDEARALKMEGLVNQQTFINCLFDGFKNCESCKRSFNENIEIKNIGPLLPGVISFLNCTIQDSELGVSLQYASNVTFDTCWFESLGGAIKVTADGDRQSTAINIINNFFANSAGFGTINPDENNKAGVVINVVDSQVCVVNNHVTASITDSALLNDDVFIKATTSKRAAIKANVTVQANSFKVPVLSKTTGVKKIK